MKTSIAWFPFTGLLALACTVDLAAGAEPVHRLTPDELTLSCMNAVIESRNGIAANLKNFTLDPKSVDVNDNYPIKDKSLIKDKYPIKIFTLKPGLSSTLNIVGIIERGLENDAEIPRFTGICLNQAPDPAPSKKPGEIDFHSHTGDKISIRFHLNKIPNDPGNLKHTSWKATGEDSIWMVGPFDEGDNTHDPPGPDDWPDCLGDTKVVTLKGADISFDFDRCANTGWTTDVYEYAIRMDQTSSGVTVGIEIDPLIINRP